MRDFSRVGWHYLDGFGARLRQTVLLSIYLCLDLRIDYLYLYVHTAQRNAIG